MVADVRVLDDAPVKPFESLEGAGRMGLDLAKYMAEHVYMYSSANARCRFRVARAMISDVIDMFGSNVVFSDETDEHVTVSARVNERAMWQFAKKAVWDYINRLRIDEGYERREQHDASFFATAENVINAFAGYGDDDSSFGFGNAQKLINMTAKYIALGIYMDDCREDFQYCHCPMDGIMVDKVTKLAGRLVDEGEEGLRVSLESFACKRPLAHDWAAKDEVRWSKLTLENRKPYEGFQEVVRALAERAGLSPLELDFCVWGSDGDER